MTPKSTTTSPGSYAAAGVDIAAADRAKRRIGRLARSTFNRHVLSEIGAFGGLFQLPAGGRRPVLVASMDGVGTKLKIAFAMRRHDTVGRDLVNHCVNDILVQAARPLFFLDYLAQGRMDAGVVAELVAGISRGCRENGCVLLGGETAEMPGFYAAGEYDVAGTIVGWCERDKLLTGAAIRPGDLLLGLTSAGLHTNGYSLARRILFDQARYRVNTRLAELGTTVGEALLAEHRSYLGALAPILGRLRGLAHITGGGIPGNLPRILPAGCRARIRLSSWQPPPLFGLLQRLGRVPDAEMRLAFNLGIGMVLVVAPSQAGAVRTHLRRHRETCLELGSVVAGRRGVTYVA